MNQKELEKMMKDKHVCSICNEEYIGFGNNADPINNGRCCDNCNDLVIVARMGALLKFKKT